MSDLISRNRSLVEWKEGFKGFVECLDMPRDDYEGIMAYIDEVPSAEPEPKKGEWINKEFYGIGEGSAECSICHKRSSGYKEDDGWGVHCLFDDFCPHCGADMREGEEE